MSLALEAAYKMIDISIFHPLDATRNYVCPPYLRNRLPLKTIIWNAKKWPRNDHIRGGKKRTFFSETMLLSKF